MSTLTQDVRHAIRILSRTPGLTVVAVLSLAITIGITGVVFTALKTVVLDPLPYARASELVALRSEGVVSNWVSFPDMEDLRRRNRTLASVGTYHYALFNLKGDGSNAPQALYGLRVSADLFPTLGVTPMIGRGIAPGEDRPGHNLEVILSYGLWRQRYNMDRNVVGRTLVANGYRYTIIGVMPPGFDFPLRLATIVRTPARYMEFWAALDVDPARADRQSAGFAAVARLKPGITRAQANEDLLSIAAGLAHEYPATNRSREIRALSLESQTFGNARPALMLLMAAAALFMLIGCSNVANLLLARSLARQREIAMRLALGAARSRIVRQLVTESCVLAIAGGACGYVFAIAAWKLLPAIVPSTVPRLDGARVDWSIFSFTLAVSIVNGFLFGILPALRTAGQDPATTLRESGTRTSPGTGRRRLTSALVTAEMAITVVLVIGGGVLGVGFLRLLRTDLGFTPDHLLASIIVPQGDAYKSPSYRAAFSRRLLDSARLLPGVSSAGLVDALPFSGENTGAFISTGDPGEKPDDPSRVAEYDRVSTDYLQTMGIRLLAGRLLRQTDESDSSTAVIVDEAAARKFWQGQDPVGKRICINCEHGPKNWRQVVGVVNSTKHYSVEAPAQPQVYAASGVFEGAQFLVLHTRGRAAEIAAALRRTVASLDPNVPVYLSAEMSTLVGDSVSDRRFTMALLVITAVLALALAAAGIYAVVSYATSMRTREIGIRMAVGATGGNVERLVLGEGMRMAGTGVAIGLAAAWAAIRLLRGWLAGIDNSDPVTIAAAVALVTTTAILACLIPARRAMRVDPMEALRHE